MISETKLIKWIDRYVETESEHCVKINQTKNKMPSVEFNLKLEKCRIDVDRVLGKTSS